MLTKAEVEIYHARGFVVHSGFLDEEALQAAQRALPRHYPTPSDYFSNPQDYEQFAASQFAGLVNFPFGSFDLNHIILTPRLVEIARQLLGTDDIRLCKGELWAKYQGAIDYDQSFHRDFGNHTLVVPRRDHRWKELTTFIYLSDVTRGSGATALIPREYTDEISFGRNRLPKDHPSVAHAEYAEGPAGTLVLYSYDVFHRGVQISTPQAARFMMLADFARRDSPWIDRHAWPHYGMEPDMIEFIEKISPDQRSLMDFPPVGHPYWNEQTLEDIQVRYPNLDIEPYRQSSARRLKQEDS